MNLLINTVSKELAQIAVSLSSFGIDEYAWNSENIICVLKELKDKKICVLGGDVYKLNGNRIEMTFDSWFIDNDDSLDFFQKSNDKALEYINNYEKNNYGHFIYSLVI